MNHVLFVIVDKQPIFYRKLQSKSQARIEVKDLAVGNIDIERVVIYSVLVLMFNSSWKGINHKTVLRMQIQLFAPQVCLLRTITLLKHVVFFLITGKPCSSDSMVHWRIR